MRRESGDDGGRGDEWGEWMLRGEWEMREVRGVMRGDEGGCGAMAYVVLSGRCLQHGGEEAGREREGRHPEDHRGVCSEGPLGKQLHPISEVPRPRGERLHRRVRLHHHTTLTLTTSVRFYFFTFYFSLIFNTAASQLGCLGNNSKIISPLQI